MLAATTQFSGTSFFTFYGFHIFEEACQSGRVFTNIQSVASLFAVVLNLFVLSKIQAFGRKTSLLLGLFMQAVGLQGIALGLIVLKQGKQLDLFGIEILLDDGNRHLIRLGMYICGATFFIGFGLGIGGVLYLYMAEILPRRAVGLATCW